MIRVTARRDFASDWSVHTSSIPGPHLRCPCGIGGRDRHRSISDSPQPLRWNSYRHLLACTLVSSHSHAYLHLMCQVERHGSPAGLTYAAGCTKAYSAPSCTACHHCAHHAGISADSHGVLAASSSGPGGNQGVIGQFNDGFLTGVADQNGNIQPFSNGTTHFLLAI